MNVELLRQQLCSDTREVAVDCYCTVYNHEKYLRRALDGMLMQKTTFPVHIWIHDDASTDRSAEIIREYAKKYPDRITYIIEDENKYQQGKPFTGWRLQDSKVKYLAVCEGDDFWIDENKLQKQVDFLEQHLDCVAVYSNILPVDKDGNFDENLRGIYLEQEERDYTKKEIHDFSLKSQTATLCSRNVFSLISPEDMNYYRAVKANGDMKRLAFYGHLGRVHILPDVTAAHRRVFDEGDSWTARVSKMDAYSQSAIRLSHYLELCRMTAHFFGEYHYRWNRVLVTQLSVWLRYRKSIFDHPKIKPILKPSDIPFYAYIVLPLYMCYSMAAKAFRALMRGIS